MDWEAIGAVGEILGAIAVVATLAYLAIQIRHAKETAADVNRLSRAVGVRELISAQNTVPGLMDAWTFSRSSFCEKRTETTQNIIGKAKTLCHFLP